MPSQFFVVQYRQLSPDFKKKAVELGSRQTTDRRFRFFVSRPHFTMPS
jgi:hypothetical protein